jgi:hypothetical protein
MNRLRHIRGSALVESTMWVPLLLLFMVGTWQFGRLTVTYYSIKKALGTVAHFAATQQGLDFCNSEDARVAEAKNLALTGSADGSGENIISGLTASMISIRLERYSTDAGITECACSGSAAGCDISQGALPPDYIVVYLSQPYEWQITLPGITLETVRLNPMVRVPVGGA